MKKQKFKDYMVLSEMVEMMREIRLSRGFDKNLDLIMESKTIDEVIIRTVDIIETLINIKFTEGHKEQIAEMIKLELTLKEL